MRALRALGLSLEEIAAAVEGPPADLAAMRDLLGTQLAALRRRAERIGRLTEQVEGLLRQLDRESMPDPDRFMTALEMISVLDQYPTPQQQEQLARRRAELGPEAVEAARTRFAALIEELLAHVGAGTPVDDPRVQELARGWDELGAAFHSGEETKRAARRLRQDRGAELSSSLPWPAERTAALVDHLERARRAR
ncbi:TipAS antibiotic-recognition domain-containing protein [Kitasatospora sp. NPDC085895]|uniref:MerR family transcriptional regulator n=1 Tax=Kitasatospora sp. NPDC085895 TaxID=3155057 RepID=UPI00344BE4D0